MLIYDALCSLLDSKINLWKYIKKKKVAFYIFLNAEELSVQFLSFHSSEISNCAHEFILKAPTLTDTHWVPHCRQRRTAARQSFQTAPVLRLDGKEKEKAPCKTHPIRIKITFA